MVRGVAKKAVSKIGSVKNGTKKVARKTIGVAFERLIEILGVLGMKCTVSDIKPSPSMTAHTSLSSVKRKASGPGPDITCVHCSSPYQVIVGVIDVF